MEYKFITQLDINEVNQLIKKNTDNELLEILFGTSNLIAKLKKNNEVILITKTRNSFKKNFYFKITSKDNKTFIIGRFRFNIFSKIFFVLSILFISIGILFTYFNIVKKDCDYITYICFFMLLVLLLFTGLIIYLKRDTFGKKDTEIILDFLKNTLKVKDLNIQ